MKTKKTLKTLSRVTIDLPTVEHKRLKAVSVMTGKSMRQIVIDLIADKLTSYKKSTKCAKSHKPNKVTARAIKDAKKGKGLKEFKTAEELFEPLDL